MLSIVVVGYMVLEIFGGIAAVSVVGEGGEEGVPMREFFGEEGSLCILDG